MSSPPRADGVRSGGADPRGESGTESHPVWRRSTARVVRKRCPRCGEGKLFRAYARLRERCAVCGLVFRREQGAQTGSMYLSAAVTQVFAALVIAVVWIGTDWSVALSIAVALPIVGAFCFAFLPYSQALWVAVEYRTDVINAEPWTAPPGTERTDESAEPRPPR